MAAAPGFPSAILRALQGIRDGSGRTIVISGPEASGKSALLASLISHLQSTGVRTHELRGIYRDRNTPYSAVVPLATSFNDEPDPTGAPSTEPEVEGPTAGFGYVPAETGRSRRTRGEAHRGRVLGVSFAVRGRGVERLDAADFWDQLSNDFAKNNSIPFAITMEEAVHADEESREFLIMLAERARLRPLLLVLVLNSSDPGYSGWESRLVGRHDVEWVRMGVSKIDPREAARVTVAFDALPPVTRRVLTFAALLGGGLTEVQLSRVTRMTFSELGDALLPASEAHLIRIEGTKVVIPHQAWIAFFPELSDPEEVRQMHREIAEALEAMHPEPTLAHRRELAEHFLKWERGPVALRYLLESAELSSQLFAYDTVDELLSSALSCVPALPDPERVPAEVELRLFRARNLLFAGRAPDGQVELRVAFDLALREQIPDERLAEWVEPILPGLQAIGPRPAVFSELTDLLEMMRGARWPETEAMLELVLAEQEELRGRSEESREVSHRVARRSRRSPAPPLDALALVTVGLTRTLGSPKEQEKADQYLRAAGISFAAFRRPELEQMTIEYRARLLRRSGAPEAALVEHLKAIPTLQRLKLPSLEAAHQLGLAEIVLDRRPDPRSRRALKRARELVELLGLNPPAPSVLRLWLLEGRRDAAQEEYGPARDRWRALVERRGPPGPAHLRSEAMVRLAALENLHGSPERGQQYFTRPEVVEMFGSNPPDWSTWRSHLRELEASARAGGAALSILLGGPYAEIPSDGKTPGSSA